VFAWLERASHRTSMALNLGGIVYDWKWYYDTEDNGKPNGSSEDSPLGWATSRIWRAQPFLGPVGRQLE
jgi:hypothetical protein